MLEKDTKARSNYRFYENKMDMREFYAIEKLCICVFRYVTNLLGKIVTEKKNKNRQAYSSNLHTFQLSQLMVT